MATTDFQIPDSYYDILSNIESSDGKNLSNPDPNSTASGLFGITTPTWDSTIARHPELAALADQKDNFDAQHQVVDALTNDNAASLRQSLGRDPTQAELYAAHHLGAGGADAFLSANPSSPASSAMSADAASGNAKEFGGKSVQQVLDNWGSQFGGSPTQTASAAAPAAPAESPAPNPYAMISRLYDQGAGLLGQQKDATSAYIASQPAIFQKLQDLQKSYTDAAKPSLMDNLSDAFNSYAGMANAGLAGVHASQGGVLLNQLPDPAPFAGALKQSQDIANQQRQARLDLAKTNYQMGSQDQLARLAQGDTNLALQNSLSSEMVKYGLETGKLTIQTIQQGMDAATKFESALKEIIPNEETRGKLSPMILNATKGSPLDVAGNLRKATQIASDAQAGKIPGLGPLQISTKEPADFYDIKTVNGGDVKHDVVNASTPEGRAKLDNYQTNFPGALPPVRLSTPTTTQTVGGSDKDGATASDYGSDFGAAKQLKSDADTMRKLLPYIGTPGPLGSSPAGLTVAGILKEAGIATDPNNVTAKDVYDKLGKKVISIQTPQLLKAAGIRVVTGREFKYGSGGILDTTFPAPAQDAILRQISEGADFAMRKADTLSASKDNAQRTGGYFNPERASIEFGKANNVPEIDPDQFAPTTATPPAGIPINAPSRVDNGVTYWKDANGNWVH